MWKRVLVLSLCLILACVPVANAAEQRAAACQPSLSFSGNTAICTGNVSEFGKTIQATMELKDGSTVIDSWSASGTHSVTMRGTCTVTRGRTYTLSITYMINGVNYGPHSITKTCPRW